MIAYAASVVGCFAGIALATFLLLLALGWLNAYLERTETRHLHAVSTSPEQCWHCKARVPFHRVDCASFGDVA